MYLTNLKTVYFLGIGGIGMSAIARFFATEGIVVFGYDRTRTALCRQLEKEGFQIHYEENIDLLPKQIDLVVYTPAIPKNHKEFVYFQKSAIPLLKRSEVLGRITQDRYCVGVAGTHGKTTISTLLAHLLIQSHVGCKAFLGGISKNYNTNFLSSPESQVAVVEADEYDRSFLNLFPKIAVISSMDADHLDIYGNNSSLQKAFSDYAALVPDEGFVFVKYGLNINRNNIETYHFDNAQADFYTKNLNVEHAAYVFDLHTPNYVIKNLVMNYPGLHNVENAVVAMAVALKLGVTADELKFGLESFQGVKRRFDFHIKRDDLIYVDDYAHHPNEIKACIESLRHLLGGKRILGVFQPHLYSRTRDFADDFAKSLSLLDSLILLDIYPAREEPIDGVTSKMILDKCTCSPKKICTKNELINEIKSQNPEVILTLGAGDIDDCVEPVTKTFSQHD